MQIAIYLYADDAKIYKKDGYRQQNVRQRQKLISSIDQARSQGGGSDRSDDPPKPGQVRFLRSIFFHLVNGFTKCSSVVLVLVHCAAERVT